MSNSRYLHTATLLRNGQILIAGGYNSSARSISAAELYDPSSDSFINTTAMIGTRAFAASTLLGDGFTVLVTGGVNASSYLVSTAKLYIAGSWITTSSSMTQSRSRPAAVLLNDENVLIAGGGNGGAVSYSIAEIYNATTRKFSVVGSMKYRREASTLTLLPSDKVLATGGIDLATSTYPVVCELYDPMIRTWSDTRVLNSGRAYHRSILLNDSVLTMGGNNTNTDGLNSTEKYFI